MQCFRGRLCLWIPPSLAPYASSQAPEVARCPIYATAPLRGAIDPEVEFRAQTLQLLFRSCADGQWHVRHLTWVCLGKATVLAGLHAPGSLRDVAHWVPVSDDSDGLHVRLEAGAPHAWVLVGCGAPAGHTPYEVGPVLDAVGVQTRDGCMSREGWHPSAPTASILQNSFEPRIKKSRTKA